jgi:hypothetical protein
LIPLTAILNLEEQTINRNDTVGNCFHIETVFPNG